MSANREKRQEEAHLKEIYGVLVRGMVLAGEYLWHRLAQPVETVLMVGGIALPYVQGLGRRTIGKILRVLLGRIVL